MLHAMAGVLPVVAAAVLPTCGATALGVKALFISGARRQLPCAVFFFLHPGCIMANFIL